MHDANFNDSELRRLVAATLDLPPEWINNNGSVVPVLGHAIRIRMTSRLIESCCEFVRGLEWFQLEIDREFVLEAIVLQVHKQNALNVCGLFRNQTRELFSRACYWEQLEDNIRDLKDSVDKFVGDLRKNLRWSSPHNIDSSEVTELLSASRESASNLIDQIGVTMQSLLGLRSEERLDFNRSATMEAYGNGDWSI